MFEIDKMRKAPVPSEADRGGVGSGSLRCPTGKDRRRPVEHGFFAIISGGEDGAGFFPVPPSAVLMLRKKGACQGILDRVEIFAKQKYYPILDTCPMRNGEMGTL